jgi:hypothetical protein
MENKPNQYYVWQKYLEPWVKDGKIVCLRNKKDIIQTNPRNIASERYFYRINCLTQSDCQLIRRLFIDCQPEPMKSLLEGWVRPVEMFLQLYDFYVKYGEREDHSIEEYKELGLKNLLENLHMNIETNGIAGLCKIQLGDLSFLSECNGEDDEDVDFILYLSFQYFRTKKIKQNVKESIGENASFFTDFDNAFNLIVPIISTVFGNSIVNSIKNKDISCYILTNPTEIPFITGDQPVINIHTSVDKHVETLDLELYYPLSPSISLLITKEHICNTECSVEKVKEYNDIIESQSLELIFANDESCLHQYISH